MTADRLNEARKNADLSWLALARRVGLSERHMRRLARGEGCGRVSVELAAQLAAALGVRPGWLAFGEGLIDQKMIDQGLDRSFCDR